MSEARFRGQRPLRSIDLRALVAVGRAEEDLHDELLGRVARRYFVEGVLQNDIAAAEHLSRPSVSRLLAEARARGVVQFRIGPPVDRVRELETLLRRRTNLRRCVVATNKPRALYGTSSRLGYAAARYLESQLAATRLFGVASSRSLSSVVDSLAAGHRPSRRCRECRGVQRTEHGAADRGTVGRRFPSAASSLRKSGSARDAALYSEMVQESLHLGSKCVVALVGVGSMQRFDGTGVYSPVTVVQLRALAAQGAVGHLCGRFLRANGSLVDADYSPAVLGIGAAELHKIPQRIAVAIGRHKNASIAAAIRGGLISELVTDHATAAALVLLLQSQG